MDIFPFKFFMLLEKTLFYYLVSLGDFLKSFEKQKKQQYSTKEAANIIMHVKDVSESDWEDSSLNDNDSENDDAEADADHTSEHTSVEYFHAYD